MTELFDVDHAYGAQCQASDLRTVHYPRSGVEVTRCGGYVKRGVTWEGRVEGTHSLLVCDAHTLKYARPEVFVEPRQ